MATAMLKEKTPVIDGPIFSCCYCAEILNEDPDRSGVSLYSMQTGEPGQAWFCHETCFRDRLHPLFNLGV